MLCKAKQQTIILRNTEWAKSIPDQTFTLNTKHTELQDYQP